MSACFSFLFIALASAHCHMSDLSPQQIFAASLRGYFSRMFSLHTL